MENSLKIGNSWTFFECVKFQMIRISSRTVKEISLQHYVFRDLFLRLAGWGEVYKLSPIPPIISNRFAMLCSPTNSVSSLVTFPEGCIVDVCDVRGCFVNLWECARWLWLEQLSLRIPYTNMETRKEKRYRKRESCHWVSCCHLLFLSIVAERTELNCFVVSVPGWNSKRKEAQQKRKERR